jgi:DNA primase
VSRIKDTSLAEVKAAADIVEVVAGRTQLRKAGARYSGRCPFHEEKTPSFSVNPVEKLYYCFGCGAKGDVITFVRETESLDFGGAIEWLAQRFNVPLEYEEASPEQDLQRRRRDRLGELLERATGFYEKLLWESAAGAAAREYLSGRSVSEETAKAYRLGLSPAENTRLSAQARKQGYTAAELSGAGLVTQRGMDAFRGRLMFPVADARGRVVGFSARKLREDDPLRGKYVNSTEGELFHKSSLLYGLHLARTAVAKEDRAILVEGQMDVLALHQAGLHAVIAPMGTALTERQLKELSRLTRRLFLCFDADNAGKEATLRGMDLAFDQGFEVRVVTLPPGQDPADAADGFVDLLGRAEAYLPYRTRLEVERARSREEGFKRAQELLARFPDSPDRQEAVRLVADLLDLARETQGALAPARGRRGGRAAELSPRLLDAGLRLEREALAGVVAHPTLTRMLKELDPEHFDDELHRRVRDHLVAGTTDEQVVALLAELDARAAAAGIDERTGEQLLLRLRERRIERELSRQEEARFPDLQRALGRVREAIRELG